MRDDSRYDDVLQRADEILREMQEQVDRADAAQDELYRAESGPEYIRSTDPIEPRTLRPEDEKDPASGTVPLP